MTGGFSFENLRSSRLTKKNMNCNSFAVSKYLSNATPIFSFDFQNANANSLYTSKDITFKASSNGTLHGLIFWFVVSLDGLKSINITNRPDFPNHWNQMCTFFPFDLVVREEDDVTLPIVHTAEKYIFGDMNQHSRIVKIISALDEYLEVYSQCDNFLFSRDIESAVRPIEDMNYRHVGTVYGTEATAVASHTGCTLIARVSTTNAFVAKVKVIKLKVRQQVWKINRNYKRVRPTSPSNDVDL